MLNTPFQTEDQDLGNRIEEYMASCRIESCRIVPE